MKATYKMPLPKVSWRRAVLHNGHFPVEMLLPGPADLISSY